MRTTAIGIPLHASAQWRDSIAETIERLGGVAQIVVSDATLLDDTLDRLQKEFAVVDGIAWRRHDRNRTRVGAALQRPARRRHDGVLHGASARRLDRDGLDHGCGGGA